MLLETYSINTDKTLKHNNFRTSKSKQYKRYKYRGEDTQQG